jgi:hypothetical protein
MRAAPAVSCAKQVTKAHTSIQVQRRRSDIPCAMALRLITRSPRRRIRLVTVVGELAASPRPVGPACLRQLDTSNGCQNHTTSPYATASFVCTPFDRSRVWLNPKPALQFTCAPDAAASTASHPNVRDDGQRPFLGDRMAGVLKVICPTAKAKFCPTGYFVAAAAPRGADDCLAYQRHCERSEAIHLTAERKNGLLRFARNDVERAVPRVLRVILLQPRRSTMGKA